MTRTLGLIPARGGSKRLPGKNLVPLGGKPLIDYTIDAARAATRLSAIVVSTDSRSIADHAATRGLATAGLRPSALAEDLTPMIDVLRHELAAFETAHGRVNAVALLQPTSPFRTGAQIDEAIALFESSGADTVTAVRPTTDHPWWSWRDAGDRIEPFHPQGMTLERAALPSIVAETGAIYVIRRDLVAAGKLYGARVVPYRADVMSAIDIDDAEDLAYAEFVLARRGDKNWP